MEVRVKGKAVCTKCNSVTLYFDNGAINSMARSTYNKLPKQYHSFKFQWKMMKFVYSLITIGLTTKPSISWFYKYKIFEIAFKNAVIHSLFRIYYL